MDYKRVICWKIQAKLFKMRNRELKQLLKLIYSGVTFQFHLHHCTLLNNVCFPSTPCEFPNTSRCVVVTHLFTVLLHSLRGRNNACKETQKVCNDYAHLRLLITHLTICILTLTRGHRSLELEGIHQHLFL